MIKVTRGKIAAPAKVVIYGVEGIGKSTLASQFPNPVFLDTEDGTRHLDVARLRCRDWQSLVTAVASLAVDRQGFGTVVIDSIDWAERACGQKVCKDHGKKSLEDWPYRAGDRHVASEFDTLLDKCDSMADAGLNVVLVAHSKVVRTSPPDQTEGFDRWELDLSKQTAPKVKEWADAVLFLNYKMRVIEGGDGKHKAIGGKDRLIFAERTAAYDAKNRHGLPAEVPMSFESLAPLFSSPELPLFDRIADYIGKAATVRTLGTIGDKIDGYVSTGELTPVQEQLLRDAIAERHNEIEPAEANA